MNIPSYMQILCDLNGNILQSPDECDVKTVFELIDTISLPKFKDDIKNIIQTEKFLDVKKLKLLDGNEYYTSIELYNHTKLCLNFSKCPESTNTMEKFWTDTMFKYSYYINRSTGIITSVSKIIENFFYKNRSDISDILKDLCEALKIQDCVLLFHNGKDHCIYCKDTLTGYKIEKVDEILKLTFKDDSIEQDVYNTISDNFVVKKYGNTYLKKFTKNESIKDQTKVYILRLRFGQEFVGFLEFVPHTMIQIATAEFKLIESLSTILAYVIHNKCEDMELEKYIQDKFSINNK